MADFIQKIDPVKLFIGFIYREERALQEVISLLTQNLGETDLQSLSIDFNLTDYYEPEMGKDLKKTFISFKNLIDPLQIIKVKLACRDIEQKYAKDGKRTINIDPGYINLFQLVLATTKPFAHRIYLGEKVFAEVTLLNHKKSFEFLPWTFPDFRTKIYTDIFTEIREIYKQQIEDV